MNNQNIKTSITQTVEQQDDFESIANNTEISNKEQWHPKLWFGHLVRALKRKMDHSYQQKRNSIVGEIFDSCCNSSNGYVLRSKSGQASYGKQYYHSLDQYKVALALHAIKLAKIKAEKSDDKTISLNLGSSNDKIRVASDKVKKVLEKPVTEIMNDILAEGRKIPPDFIQCALVPHLAERLIERFDYKPDEAMSKVKNAMANAEIQVESDITFERMVVLKNMLTLHSSRSMLNQDEINAQTPLLKDNIEEPWLNAPKLEAPKSMSNHLDEEDRQYIQKMVENGKGIKLARHDHVNRFKRLALRNKKKVVKSTIGTALSMTFGAVTTGGPAGAVGAAIRTLTTVFSIIGVTALINAVRVSRNIQAMEKYSDYNTFRDKRSGIVGYNRKRHKKFLDAAKLVCSKKSLADAYNMFSELEKDVEMLEKKNKVNKNNTSVNSVIEREEMIIRCRYRNNSLNRAMAEYVKLYKSGVESFHKIEAKGDEYSELLWDNLFRDMDPDIRAQHIMKASKDPKLFTKRYRFQTNDVPWEKLLFKSKKDDQSEVQVDDYEENEQQSIQSNKLNNEVVRDLAQDPSHKPVEYIKRRPFIKQVSKWGQVIGIKSVLKVSNIIGKPVFVRSGAIDVSEKVSPEWSDSALEKEILEVLPTVSAEGALIFGGLVLGEVLIEAVNEKQRHARLKKIRKEEDTYSGIGFLKRKRTKREEINTLRESAKVKLGDFISTIKKVSKKNALLNDKLEDLKKISELRGEEPFQGLHPEEQQECMQIMMHRELYRQIFNHKLMGSISLFYERVKKYQDNFDKRVLEALQTE